MEIAAHDWDKHRGSSSSVSTAVLDYEFQFLVLSLMFQAARGVLLKQCSRTSIFGCLPTTAPKARIFYQNVLVKARRSAYHALHSLVAFQLMHIRLVAAIIGQESLASPASANHTPSFPAAA